jgi:lipid-binding SYLF domain-containing protein
MIRRLSVTFLVAFLALAAGPARADSKTDARLEKARIVFEQFADISEQQIPGWLLERAYGIAVIPDVIKGALVLGGRGGRGVLAVRNPDGSWSAPVFVTLAGVNVGFQWGVQSTDVVLVFLSRPSVEGIAGGKITLGADASVAAGPVGRSAAATTDAMLKAQVLSYSRNEGLFAGVALDGSWISIDDKSNATAYNWSGVLPGQAGRWSRGSAPR